MSPMIRDSDESDDQDGGEDDNDVDGDARTFFQKRASTVLKAGHPGDRPGP